MKTVRKNGMSALPPKADMFGATGDVRFGPIADIDRYFSAPIDRPRAAQPVAADVSYQLPPPKRLRPLVYSPSALSFLSRAGDRAILR